MPLIDRCTILPHARICNFNACPSPILRHISTCTLLSPYLPIAFCTCSSMTSKANVIRFKCMCRRSLVPYRTGSSVQHVHTSMLLHLSSGGLTGSSQCLSHQLQCRTAPAKMHPQKQAPLSPVIQPITCPSHLTCSWLVLLVVIQRGPEDPLQGRPLQTDLEAQALAPTA